MARVTIEDCLNHVDNMYELVHVTTLRTRQLLNGSGRTVRCKNKEIVAALREIAAGHIVLHEEKDDENHNTI